MLQRLADRAAHELKNPLNGAVLNVEVVRQRARRPEVDASTLVPYAEAAAAELERAAELIDALLTLARPAHAPVDLIAVLGPLGALYGAIAAQTGGEVRIEHLQTAVMESDAEPDAVRFALAAVLDAAVADANVRCRLDGRGERWAVEVRCAEGDIALLASVRRAIVDAGMMLSDVEHGIAILFPRSSRGRTDGAE